MVEIENIHKKDEQPESETPDEQEIDAFHNMMEKIFSRCQIEDIAKLLEGQFDAAKDLKTMAEGFETMCVCLYDANNFLKIIAGDLITIRKFLTKEDEVKNADADNSEKSKN